MKTLRTLAVIACFSLAVGTVSAAIIHDNGAPNGLGGSNMTQFGQLDDFTTTGVTNLTSIRFFALIANLNTDFSGMLDWAIFADNGGAPDNNGFLIGSIGPIVPTVTNTGVMITLGNIDYTRYQFDFPISVPNLTAGVWWLALVDLLGGPDFLWETTGVLGFGNGYEHDFLIDPSCCNFQLNANDKAFIVFGDQVRGGQVPEPATTVLVSGGVAGLIALRRRRSRRA